MRGPDWQWTPEMLAALSLTGPPTSELRGPQRADPIILSGFGEFFWQQLAGNNSVHLPPAFFPRTLICHQEMESQVLK